MRPTFTDRMRDVFTIDLRSLAAFRIGLACLLLFDLIYRWRLIGLLYTDDGILPRAGLKEIYGSSVAWTSLHYHMSGSVGSQSILFAIGVVFALALLVGFRTWWMTLLSWMMIASLHRRLPYVMHGGDQLLSTILLWSLLLPLGAKWSIDSRAKSQGEAEPANYFSVATVGILLQVCIIYWFTFLHKWHPDWHEGRALGEALQTYFYAKPLGSWLRQRESLTMFFNYATLGLEALGPFVALFPWRNSMCRMLAIAMFVGLHIGIAATMRVGLFSYVSIVCWLLFVPSAFWDRFSKMSQQPRPALVETGFLRTVCAAALLLFVLAFNLLGLPALNRMGLRNQRPMRLVSSLLRTKQKWNMFAPTADKWNGWFIMPAMLKDGSSRDIWLDKEPATTSRPLDPGAAYPNIMVKRFMTGERYKPNSTGWLWFARHTSREWNASHSPDKAIKLLQILYVSEPANQNQPLINEMINYDVVTDQIIVRQ